MPANVHIVKAMDFPIVMCGCEVWTIKKAEHWRTGAFRFWCWRRLLRVLWTARRSKQSILKEINPEYSLEGLMLKPKFQYFGHLMRRADSLEKTLMLGKIEGTENEMVGWHHQLYGLEFEQTPGDGEGQGILVCCSPWGHKESDTTTTTCEEKWDEDRAWFTQVLPGSGSGHQLPTSSFVSHVFPHWHARVLGVGFDVTAVSYHCLLGRSGLYTVRRVASLQYVTWRHPSCF